MWIAWAGYPCVVACDRGLHNYGAFAKNLAANAIYLRPVGVEAAEMIGRGERHGGILKHNVIQVIRINSVVGKAAVKRVLAASTSMKNEMVRTGGIAPSQWVLGKIPRDEAENGTVWSND